MQKTQQFLTRTFFDLYDNPNDFINDFGVYWVHAPISTEEKQYLYNLLAGKYGDSNIRYTNSKLFILNLFKEINNDYPRILAFARDQKILRDTDNMTFMQGGNTVQNMAANNTADVDTFNDTGIDQVDSQAVTIHNRALLATLGDRISKYRFGMESEFIDRLSYLFIQVIQPMADLLFGTDPTDWE